MSPTAEPALRIVGPSTPTDDINPKARAGFRKLPMELVPAIALVQEAAVLGLGADCPDKAYGRWNWRDTVIDVQTYLGAMERHRLLWAAGEDIDEQSGVSHLAHIRAGCAILMDAADAGTLVDNRVRSPETIRLIKAYDAATMPVVKPPAP